MKARSRHTAVQDPCRAGDALSGADGRPARLARRYFSFYAWRFS